MLDRETMVLENHGEHCKESLKIACAVLSYWTVSIVLVFANKYLVGNRQSSGDVSLFVAWMQCIIVVLVVTAARLIKALRTRDWRHMAIRRDHVFCKPILMNTVTFVSMLSFNNLCLRYVGVAFYQVARSLTLVFTAVLSVVLLKGSMSFAVVLCCLTVVGGFLLGVDQEQLIGNISFEGVAFGMISSVCVALNGIFTKRALDVIEDDVVQLTYCVHINASCLFIPVIMATGQIGVAIWNPDQRSVYFWACLGVTGSLAFLIAWVSALQISYTSPVTHNISGSTKAVLQTLIAVLYLKENKPALWWLSNLLVVGGATAYTVIRYREQENNSSSSLQPQAQDTEAAAQKFSKANGGQVMSQVGHHNHITNSGGLTR